MASRLPGLSYWLTKCESLSCRRLPRSLAGAASDPLLFPADLTTCWRRAVKTSLGPDASALSVNKQCLYLSVTNDTIGTPLPQSVGPGFAMPPSVGYGLPAFEPLSASALTLAEVPTQS